MQIFAQTYSLSSAENFFPISPARPRQRHTLPILYKSSTIRGFPPICMHSPHMAIIPVLARGSSFASPLEELHHAYSRPHIMHVALNFLVPLSP